MFPNSVLFVDVGVSVLSSICCGVSSDLMLSLSLISTDSSSLFVFSSLLSSSMEVRRCSIDVWMEIAPSNDEFKSDVEYLGNWYEYRSICLFFFRKFILKSLISWRKHSAFIGSGSVKLKRRKKILTNQENTHGHRFVREKDLNALVNRLELCCNILPNVLIFLRILIDFT